MNSYRRIFKSSAIIGGASVINILIGITKVKVLAVLLGPAGVGLMGVFQNLVSMASTVAALGVGNSGVRQIAASAEDIETLSIVRRSLWYGNLILGSTGMLALWALREPAATLVFGNSSYVNEVAWLGLGVLLTLIAGSQTALLQGLRRVGDLAKVKIGSALVAAIVGISLVYILGERGVLWFVIAAPAGSVLVAGYYAKKLPRPQSSADWIAIRGHWQAMLALGIPSMVGVSITLLGSLLVRSIIMNSLGPDAAGFYQAAWTISTTYIGFVLAAMNTDYYPKLVKALGERLQVSVTINEQTEMSLLMVGPLLLTMLIAVPLIVPLLYSDQFYPSIEILRWQLIGDIFKTAAWSIALTLMASGRGWLSVGSQIVWNAIYVGGVYFGLNKFGLTVTGFAFLLAYAVYFIFIFFLIKVLVNYQLGWRLWILIFTLFVSAFLLGSIDGFKVSGVLYIKLAIWVSVVTYCIWKIFYLLQINR